MEIKDKTTTELMDRLLEITILSRNLETEYNNIAQELWQRADTPAEETGLKLERKIGEGK